MQCIVVVDDALYPSLSHSCVIVICLLLCLLPVSLLMCACHSPNWETSAENKWWKKGAFISTSQPNERTQNRLNSTVRKRKKRAVCVKENRTESVVNERDMGMVYLFRQWCLDSAASTFCSLSQQCVFFFHPFSCYHLSRNQSIFGILGTYQINTLASHSDCWCAENVTLLIKA